MKIICFLHPRYHPKIIGDILNENEAGTEKNKSGRYDINRPRHKHGHKYNKYKMCLGILKAICIKQHLSNFEV